MSSALPADETLLPSRPVKEAVSEIIAASILSLLITLVLGTLPGGSEWPALIAERAPQAGKVVLQHIGWAFGAYIPILLGFYAMVLGGQLVATPVTAGRIRRKLGLVAEAMAGGLVPALVLIGAACIDEPAQAGALFVIVPVAAVMFFLATQLGGLAVFERTDRLAIAERTRDWAKEQLRSLRPRSRTPIWLVVLAHALLGALIGLVTAWSVSRPPSSVIVLSFLYGMTALGLAFAGANAVYSFHIARDRKSRIMAWPLPASLYLVGLALALELYDEAVPAAGIGVLIVVGFSAVSTLWPRTRWSRFPMNWTIQGASTGYAAKTIATNYAQAMREIRKLRPQPNTDQDVPPTLGDRIGVAVDAVREVFASRAV